MTFFSFPSRRFSISRAPSPDTVIAENQTTNMHAQLGMVQPENIANATAFLLIEEADTSPA